MRWRLSLGLAFAVMLGAPLLADPAGIGHEVDQFIWHSEASRFGGFSALEVDTDGLGFSALSDRGAWVQGQIIRKPDGQIERIEIGEIRSLLPFAGDSEGLAIGPDGMTYVSFEGEHRVVVYTSLSGEAKQLPVHGDFSGMIPNASFEALAIAPDGAVYTLPERSGHLARPFPVYRFHNGKWSQPFSLPRTDNFLPVGADFGPDGNLYLLERRFQLVRGFATRVRRFSVTSSGLEEETLIFESQVGKYHNLEGISVWREANGNLRLTMIADDNFNFFQATEIVEYSIKEMIVNPLVE